MTTLERRMAAGRLDFRETSDSVTLTGYASTFNQPYSMGWYTEDVDPAAFNRTLGRKPDVRFLLNHDGLPLARTSSGTLQLDTDDKGLHVRADLDPSDPDVAGLVPKMRRGDLNQMSFAFRLFGKDGDEWNDEMTKRTLRSLDLDDGDVSVVTYPANPNTSAGIRQGGGYVEAVQSALRALEARGASQEQVEGFLRRLTNPEAVVTLLGNGVQIERGVRATSASLPLLNDRNHAWEAAAAEGRVRSWAGGSSDLANMDWAKYGRAFFWHDRSAPEQVGSYKLPFADVVDGSLTAVWRGITGDAAVLQGGRGGVDIPDSDREAVKAAVAAYYAKAATLFDDKSIMPPWSDEAKSAAVEAEIRQREVAQFG